MTDQFDEVEALWKTPVANQPLPDLQNEVVKQTRRWYLLIATEVLAILIGIVVPLVVVLETPEPFWFVWAIDLWGVVLVSSWFTFTRVRDVLSELDQSTQGYQKTLQRRYTLQVNASKAGILLALLQFIILPLLAWWDLSTKDLVFADVALTYALVLAVMAGYIVVMSRVRSNAEDQLKRLL